MKHIDLVPATEILLEEPGERKELECKRIVHLFIEFVGLLKNVKPGEIFKYIV